MYRTAQSSHHEYHSVATMKGGGRVRVTRPCPYESAGFFSRLCFAWLIPLFRTGYSKDLELDDLFRPISEDAPRTVSHEFHENWTKELKREKSSLFRAIYKTFGPKYLLIIQLQLIPECFIRTTQPFLIGAAIRYFTKDPNRAPVNYQTACWCLVALASSSIISRLMRVHYMSYVMRIGLNFRNALTVELYKKIVKLSKSSLEITNIGQILNIITNDFERLRELCTSLPDVIAIPIQTVAVIWIMWSYVGVACLGGLVIVLLAIPVQTVMSRYFRLYRRKSVRVTDKRVKLMNELIAAMKLIKLYCWEKPFANLVAGVRGEEIRILKISSVLRAINGVIGLVQGRAMLFATYIVHLSLGGALDPETVFVTMALFNVIRGPLTRTLPGLIGLFAESTDFLNLPEKSHRAQDSVLAKGTVELRKYYAKWKQSDESNALNSLNLRVEPGELAIVIGSVGSGKSCLLSAVLNELHDVDGTIVVSGTTSYSPQESWCFGGTVRENILLSSEFDEERFEQVIKVCGLERDMKIFPNADLTVIGEKGYTLSGGQKARVTLARAVYQDADVYLLDDPLSAVDPAVAKHIFENCVKGILKEKTVILVTHQLQFIGDANKIVLFKDGSISSTGTYQKLISSGVDFLSFVNHEQSVEAASLGEKEEVKRKKSMSLTINDEKEAKDKEHQKRNQIKSEESRATGAVTWSVYWNYIRSGATVTSVVFIFVVWIVGQSVVHYTDLWLSNWTNTFTSSALRTSQMFNSSSNVTVGVEEPLEVDFDETQNIWIYAGLTAAVCVAGLIKNTSVIFVCLNCSIALHDMCFKSLIRAKITFFETNSLGRILNRFTRDMGAVDTGIARLGLEVITDTFSAVGTLALSAYVSPITFIPAFALFGLSYPIRTVHVRTSRDVKRWDSVTKSPVYGHIATTIDGLTTVRALSLEHRFEEQFLDYLEDASSTRFTLVMSMRGTGFALDVLALVYLCAVCFVLIVFSEGLSGGYAGLLITSAMSIVGMFQMLIRMSANLETQMVSVERVLEYSKLESEPPLISSIGSVLKNWPSGGNIQYSDVSLTYPGYSMPVLKHVQFEVAAGEKVGVVGRTGAGKTSLLTVLFRLVEYKGLISIDGVDITSMGLHELRSKMSIIPQDPLLFSGTIRRNLDPFEAFDDSVLWRALKEANMGDYANSSREGLDTLITEGGSNLSVGQRQLLCLARALLGKNKILVLDEATANVDLETDELIQSTIRTKFSKCTVLTIAHRINTVVDMDKVLVMDDGQVVEFDDPHLLLKARGYFWTIVEQTGPEYARLLSDAAEKAFKKRNDGKIK